MLDRLPGLINATDPNLDAFQKRGGKMIQYHGWGDSQFTPGWTVHYYNEVINRVAQGTDAQALAQTQDYYRLFMMPGVGHCTGGPGPNTIGGLQQPAPPVADATHDLVSAMQLWVESGVAPQQFIATKYVNDDPAQGIALQRPVCAYPSAAIYVGFGPTTNPNYFVCQPSHSMMSGRRLSSSLLVTTLRTSAELAHGSWRRIAGAFNLILVVPNARQVAHAD